MRCDIFWNRIPLLLLYGSGDFRADLDAELDLGLSEAIEQAGPPTRLVTVDQKFEGWSSLSVQELLIKEVLAWLGELTAKTER